MRALRAARVVFNACAAPVVGIGLVLTVCSIPAPVSASSQASQSGASSAMLDSHDFPTPTVRTWYIGQSDRSGWSIGVNRGRVWTVDLKAHPNERAAARWVLEEISVANPANVSGIATSWFDSYSTPTITIWRIHWAENQNQCLDLNSRHYLVLGVCGATIFGWSEENGPLWSFFGPTKKRKTGRPSNGPPLVVMPKLPSVEPWTTLYSGEPGGNQRFTAYFAGDIT